VLGPSRRLAERRLKPAGALSGGLEFADLGYVLVAGHLALADHARAVRENPEVGRLFLGG
jgi:hypothetical protein